MIKWFLSCLILMTNVSLLKAQENEHLRPLTTNLNYIYSDLKANPIPLRNVNQNKTQSTTIQLPFLDDFYYANYSNYPDQNLWLDSSVYVNTGYPIAPLSIGVATFDGLNKFGYPHGGEALPNFNLPAPADVLTSRPINLHEVGAQILLPSDSVALTFYYQAGGNGDFPEPNDSLILDFYNPSSHKWTNAVWFKKGPVNANNPDTTFKRVFIPITDTSFLKDSFQFRFRNWATIAGNFDHWHIDYVYLNKNRSAPADTVYNDIAFENVPSSFLQNYSAIPYEQYNESEMAKRNSVRMRNSGFSTQSMTYENKFYDPSGTEVHNYNGGADNVPSYRKIGCDTAVAHRNPVFNYSFTPMQDSIDYKIKHYIFRSSGVSSDFIIPNDTVVQYQRFRNYYAFDDGSAEAGYYLNGAAAKMALKITVNVADSLRGLRIYFDRDGYLNLAKSSYKFRICVWAAAIGGPSNTLILKDSLVTAKYPSSEYNLFHEYNLTTPLALSPGTYYIGVQQAIASGITVGFDMNNDYHTNLYYNVSNVWNQSSQKGSLMMRPIFGKKVIPPLSISENYFSKKDVFIVYPNPASDFFTIQSRNIHDASFQLFNTMGQLIREEDINQTVSDDEMDSYNINTSQFSNGIYFLVLKKNNTIVQQHKIIIQH